MTPHRKKCPHVVHFNVPRDWFETNLPHQKRYSEGGKKIRGCRGLLGRVIIGIKSVFEHMFSMFSLRVQRVHYLVNIELGSPTFKVLYKRLKTNFVPGLS